MIISSADRARDLNQPPVYIMGVAEGYPYSPSAITRRPNLTRLGLAKAAPKAFAMAEVTPADLQVAGAKLGSVTGYGDMGDGSLAILRAA